MSFSVVKSVQYLTVTLPPSIPCDGMPHSGTVSVEVDQGAPAGPIMFQVIGTTPSTECDTITTVTVLENTATLVFNPSSIPALTAWPGMPPNISQADLLVTWDAPECEGTLQIVLIEGTGGYVPPSEGTLTQEGSTLWRYTAFEEPQTVLCPEFVKVWIAAMKDGQELPGTRKSILVQPVHTWWTQSNPPDYQSDYNYLTWKYATVLATTGGAFSAPPTFSADTFVSCQFSQATACTHVDDSVEFGASAFTGSENAAASIIGHELRHTVGILNADECTAYTWEFQNDSATGIFQCDAPHLANVAQNMSCHCDGINCP
jgi:hypothetical protein